MLLVSGGAAYSAQEAAEAPAPEDAAQAESRLKTALFREGTAKYDAGEYEASIVLFDSVLTIDPYHDGAIGYLKKAAAAANCDLGVLAPDKKE